MIKILLSKKLGELRLTQADLARATGIRPNTINELYHELADRVNLEHLDLICEALDCDLEDLIIRIPNSEPRVRTRTGFELHTTPHMFRHTFATSLLEADVDIRYIQEMLGHSSINVTEIYTHVALAKQKNILSTKHPRNNFPF